jgi:hypothetical protein
MVNPLKILKFMPDEHTRALDQIETCSEDIQEKRRGLPEAPSAVLAYLYVHTYLHVLCYLLAYMFTYLLAY